MKEENKIRDTLLMIILASNLTTTFTFITIEAPKILDRVLKPIIPD